MPRVLMIDDDQQVSAVLAMALEALGHDVTISNVTEKAEELCKEVKPDLILLDMMMPGRSGIELLKPLTQISPDAVICMMTGLVDDKLLAKSLEAGAWNILYKPYSLAELSELVKLSELLSHAIRNEKNGDEMTESPLELSWTGDQQFTADDIAKLVSFAAAAGANSDLANRRLPVVAAELLINAQTHGIARQADQRYGLICSKNDASLALDVSDSGKPFNWQIAARDFRFSAAGGSAPGLQLVRALADSLSFSEKNKTVHAVFIL
ncbi:response regulator [bacterium]|nr:response regulator [bacterium]MBU1637102.1 response regulator [bacterium]MBU1919404.1 response regulator [bacterium]